MKWLIVAGLGVAVAGAETLAAASVALLVDTLSDPSQPAMELPIIGNPGGAFDSLTSEDRLRVLGVAIAVIFVVKALLEIARTYAQARVAQNTGYRLADRLYKGYINMPYLVHTTRNSAELLRNSNISADETVLNFITPITNIIIQSILLAFLATLLLVAAPQTTLILIAALVPTTVIVLRMVRPALRRLGESSQAALKDSLGSAQQSLHGIRDIKAFGKEKPFMSEYAETRRRLARARYLQPPIARVPSLFIETALVLVVVGFLALGSGSNTAIALPLLALFAYAGLRMMPAMSSITAAINRLRFGQAAADILVGELELVEGYPPNVPDDEPETLQFEREFVLDAVKFSYPDGTPVFAHLDLNIKKGMSLGIVGPTGAGKSSLLDLILGLIEPTEGHIRCDGEDLVDVRRSWQRIVGFVPQSINLRDESLKRNVAFGVAPDQIELDRVLSSVHLAQLGEFVGTLPDGIETVVGERGVRLSGGQRQRVAIARALYRDPQVVILDEGTASLDTRTETEFLHALEALRGNRTLITVAHRISTVQNCDRIVLLDAGQIVDAGTYDELLNRSRTFRELAG